MEELLETLTANYGSIPKVNYCVTVFPCFSSYTRPKILILSLHGCVLSGNLIPHPGDDRPLYIRLTDIVFTFS